MKASKSRTLRYLIASVFVVLTFGVAWKAGAQTAEPPESPTSVGATLAQRLLERRVGFNPQLSTASRSKIVDNCQAAQGKLSNWKTKDEAAAEKRSKIYSSLYTKLETINKKLDKQGMKSTELNTAGQKFGDAINAYLGRAQKHKIARDDLLIIDCKNDPEGFSSTLLETRQLRTQLAADAASVKAQLPELAEALTVSKQALINADPQASQEAQ